MARRRDRARTSIRGYRDQAVRHSRLDVGVGQWRRLPRPVRTFTPVVVLLTIAATYPFYLASLPSGNVPLIYSFPSVRSAVTILVFTTMAVGLNVVVGYCGLLDLGYVAFYAIGAYTGGWLASGQFQQVKFHFGSVGISHDARGIHISIWLVLLCAAALTAIGGILIGLPTLRLRGDYLAIATLGFGEIIYTVINATDQVGPFEIGGASGLHGIPIVTNFFWTFAWVVVCVVCVWRLAYSTKGLAFRAVREDEIAAAAMGVDTTFFKVAAFVIGAFFAGVAGGLLATYDGNLAPESFRFTRSIEIVVMVVLGGSGSITGSILAAVVLTFAPEVLRTFADWRMVIYSLALIGTMLLRPEGLLGSREIWWGKRRQGPAKAMGHG